VLQPTSLAAASVGAHALPVLTGAYARDTAEIFDHFAMDDEAVTEQARAVLEDMPIHAIKVGFVGKPRKSECRCRTGQRLRRHSAGGLHARPVLVGRGAASMPTKTRAVICCCRRPPVLVGNHSTLARWLLPDWSADKAPSARDIARAAARTRRRLHLGNRHTAARAVHRQRAGIAATPCCARTSIERFEAVFAGAGDTLSAALAALLASEHELTEAVGRGPGVTWTVAWTAGFAPAWDNAVPDRLFWAQADAAG